jgi:integrase
MASVQRLDRDGRAGFRIRFYVDKKRREIYVAGDGKSAERMAGKIADYLESLALAQSKNEAPDPKALAWANSTKGRLRDSLVGWGLADAISERSKSDAGRFLGAFVRDYIKSRSDVKDRTKNNFEQAAGCLIEYFGDRKPLRSITMADVARWRRWLESDRGLAPTTANKHAKRGRTFFLEAVRDRLLESSPFEGLKIGDESNPDRQRFIDREMATKVVEACPDIDWRVIFGLARFAGLRCPSEVMGLKWTDIDWDAGRLRIDAPKTGLRYCPMFPEVRVVLADAFDQAVDGAVFVVARRTLGDNLRTQFNRIVERAGIKPWPKPFCNCRASCRTELQERFPSHVINKWLGQSSAVAEKHYLQTTDEHWQRAVESRPPIGPPINGNQGPLRPITKTTKPRENRGSDGSGELVTVGSIPPQGFEQTQKPTGKSGCSDSRPPIGPPIPDEVLLVWRDLSPADRAAWIEFGRALLQNKNIPSHTQNTQ